MSGERTVATVTVRDERREAGTVRHVVVANPSRLNVIGTSAIEALCCAFDEAAANDAVRVAVLEGAGERAWIGGADIGEMGALDATGARAFIEALHGLCDGIRRLPIPVVAAIRGWCLGAGLEVAACCDLRLAAASGRFGMPEVRVGIPSVIEAALLPRLVGAGRARDLVMTGRIIDAADALAWGLVDGVVPDDALGALVDARVDDLLAGAPQALAAQKRLCRAWEELALGDAVAAGIEAFEQAYRGAEPGERMHRFLERRRDRRD